jgi:hypothetical protein
VGRTVGAESRECSCDMQLARSIARRRLLRIDQHSITTSAYTRIFARAHTSLPRRSAGVASLLVELVQERAESAPPPLQAPTQSAKVVVEVLEQGLPLPKNLPIGG